MARGRLSKEFFGQDKKKKRGEPKAAQEKSNQE